MSASRLKSLGKLVLLIGTPVALVTGLFGAGVYVGQGHRASILAFERDWLGFDVEVPGEPAKPEVKPETKPEPKPETKPEVKPEPKPETKVETPKPEPKLEPKPEVKPEPALDAAIPIAVAPPEPLDPAVQARLAEPVKVRVKLVVDADVFDRRPDWIAYAQRHVGWASEIFSRQLGVQLELRGIVASKSTWSDGQAALAELQNADREGADLVVGLGGRSVRAPMQSLIPGGSSHATAAVAFADPSSRAPHLRGLLRAVGQAMGGELLGEASGDATPITFHAGDRRIVLDRKHLPFSSEPAPTPAPADEPEGAE